MKLLRWACCSTLLVWLLTTICFAQGQHVSQYVPSDLPKIDVNKSGNHLYLISDKTIYTPGELFWFSTYFLIENGGQDDFIPNMMSVGLINVDSAEYFLKKDFIVHNGLCAGSFSLPDSIGAGEYVLVAAGNVLDEKGMPVYDYFTPITIKSIVSSTLNVAFSELNTTNKDELLLESKVWYSDGQPVKGKNNIVTYKLSTGWKAEANMNIIGRSKLTIPRQEIERSNHILYTETKVNGKVKKFSYQLENEEGTTKSSWRSAVHNDVLLADLLNSVSYSVKRQGASQVVPVQLYENESLIGEMRTNELGFGNFLFKAKSGHSYVLKTDGESIFRLPEVKGGVASAHLLRQVANDTLRVTLSSLVTDKYTVGIKNLGDSTFQFSEIDMNENDTKRVVIPLGSMKKGFSEFVLLNGQGEKIKDEFFFAKYNRATSAKIDVEKEEYTKRNLINVSVSLLDNNQKSVEGIFTIYCVATTRIDVNKKYNFPGYSFLNYWQTAGSREFSSITDNHMLGQTIAMSRPSFSSVIKPANRVEISGQIFDDTHKISKVGQRFSLLLRSDSSFFTRETDSLGKLKLDMNEFAVQDGRALYIYPSLKGFKFDISTAKHYVGLTDVMKQPMNKLISSALTKVERKVFSPIQSDTSYLVKGLPSKYIEEVTVYARPRDVRGDRGNFLRNECGDYVCQYNVLNCQNHPFGGKPAVQGRHYIINGMKRVYMDCDAENKTRSTLMKNVAQLFYGREFQGMSKTDIDPSVGETYLSTIYWAPYSIYDGKTDNKFSFYASDLSGDYKIIVEGMTLNGDFYYNEKTIKIH